MLFWLAIVWRTMLGRQSLKTTTLDKTAVIFERRCERGHFHIHVVPRYLIPHLQAFYPGCGIRAIDKALMPEAQAIVDFGLEQ
jgi:diadenosine tetraphosphate (Ap4A) HIT family hydrolase